MTARKDKPPPQEFVISAGMIKWTVGIVGGILTVVVAWFAVWDRIDSHWRLESVQAANDKRIDADLKATKDKAADDFKIAVAKAEQDTKALAQRAEVGRAWVRASVIETKAYTAAGFARICRALKLPAEECDKQKEEAAQFKVEATAAKTEALTAGKDR